MARSWLMSIFRIEGWRSVMLLNKRGGAATEDPDSGKVAKGKNFVK